VDGDSFGGSSWGEKVVGGLGMGGWRKDICVVDWRLRGWGLVRGNVWAV
jgi:hypothetical protein